MINHTKRKHNTTRPAGLSFLIICTFCLFSCNTATVPVKTTPLTSASISDITSYHAEQASKQAYNVIVNNYYSQEFFEKVFMQVVENLKQNKDPKNAEIIKKYLIQPLVQTGHVPPAVVKKRWNYYFSSSFVSLPNVGNMSAHCSKLAQISENIVKEYNCKIDGFEICGWPKPTKEFGVAMDTFDAIWAVCNPPAFD
ncbi:MAG: hypothetical protein KJ550_03755 [Proteobacteria bacterium]|nr:hypothetical protein [Desulfobacteraceae bacterium]MBU4012561.1 hypothetical protein [Pseudomonadota bacterium]MBU4068321.1 hypothetical protein [Pseudomonadota bacterium]MBU4099978.1 hypothetical protein [Pseudomonadota bacterium]